jgi:hypothetical protein
MVKREFKADPNYLPGPMPGWIAQSYGEQFKKEWLAGILRQDSDTGEMFYVIEQEVTAHPLAVASTTYRPVTVQDIRDDYEAFARRLEREARSRRIRELVELEKRRQSRTPDPVAWISAARECVAKAVQSIEIPFSQMEEIPVPLAMTRANGFPGGSLKPITWKPRTYRRTHDETRKDLGMQDRLR